MSVGVARYAALALSVALGVGAGAGTAYVLDGIRDTSTNDPLGLGVDLVNQGCTGEAIIIQTPTAGGYGTP